ncbi:serine/threonine kinase [Anaeramoeba flamelloides]|uniref:Serine/threonine kinase n=1 Tax=Anaeramoeba flamelloides TaxID=1746091 RepID=A0ABQ8Y566_9EUKA|nr:serine/threonine kinase [Anaeramoeba flamelloides]
MFDLNSNYKASPFTQYSPQLKGCSALHKETFTQCKVYYISKDQNSPIKNNKNQSKIKHHQGLFHLNLINPLQFSEDDQSWVVVTEQFEGCNLKQFIKKKIKNKKSFDSGFIFVQLFNVVKYLCSQNIYSCDLRLCNILINEECRIKIKLSGIIDEIKTNQKEKPDFVSVNQNLKMGKEQDYVLVLGLILRYLVVNEELVNNSGKKISKNFNSEFRGFANCGDNLLPVNCIHRSRFLIRKMLRKKANLRPIITAIENHSWVIVSKTQFEEISKVHKRYLYQNKISIFNQIDLLALLKMEKLNYKPESVIKSLIQTPFDYQSGVYKMIANQNFLNNRSISLINEDKDDDYKENDNGECQTKQKQQGEVWQEEEINRLRIIIDNIIQIYALKTKTKIRDDLTNNNKKENNSKNINKNKTFNSNIDKSSNSSLTFNFESDDTFDSNGKGELEIKDNLTNNLNDLFLALEQKTQKRETERIKIEYEAGLGGKKEENLEKEEDNSFNKYKTESKKQEKEIREMLQQIKKCKESFFSSNNSIEEYLKLVKIIPKDNKNDDCSDIYDTRITEKQLKKDELEKKNLNLIIKNITTLNNYSTIEKQNLENRFSPKQIQRMRKKFKLKSQRKKNRSGGESPIRQFFQKNGRNNQDNTRYRRKIDNQNILNQKNNGRMKVKTKRNNYNYNNSYTTMKQISGIQLFQMLKRNYHSTNDINSVHFLDSNINRNQNSFGLISEKTGKLAIQDIFNSKKFQLPKKKLAKLIIEIFNYVGINWEKIGKYTYICQGMLGVVCVNFITKLKANNINGLSRIIFQKLDRDVSSFHRFWVEVLNSYPYLFKK